MSFARKSLIAAAATATVATGAFAAPAFAAEGSSDAVINGGTNGNIGSSDGRPGAVVNGEIGGEGNVTPSSSALPTAHTEAGMRGEAAAGATNSSDAAAEVGANSNSSQRLEAQKPADEAKKPADEAKKPAALSSSKEKASSVQDVVEAPIRAIVTGLALAPLAPLAISS